MMDYSARILTAAVLSSSLFVMGAVSAAPLDVPGGGAACAGTCITEGVNFSADGILTVADAVNIGATDGVSATTAANNTGTIDFAGDSVVAGSIGATGKSLLKIELNGPAGKSVTLNGDVTAGSIEFADDGVLKIGDGANVMSPIFAQVAGDGTVQFLGASNVTQDVGTAGSLNNIFKEGAGTVTLNGATEASTKVQVKAGTLDIRANVTSPNLTVDAGATLLVGAAGLSTSATVDNNGVINVGANTLTLTANPYNQNAGSTLAVTVSSGGSGSIDATAAGAVINPGSTVAVTLGGSVSNGSTFDIVTDGLGALGVPGTITGGTPVYSFALASVMDNLQLTVNRNDVSSILPAGSPVTGVASALDSVAGIPGSGLAPIILNVEAQPTAADMERVLATIAPTSDSSLMVVSQNNVNQGINSASHRMEQLRVAMHNPGYVAGDMSNDNASWVQFFGSDIDQDMRNGVAGYDAWNAGFAVGGDHEFMPGLLVGAGFSYAYTDVDSKFFTANKLDAQTYQGFVYGSWVPMESYYVDALVSLAFHDYNTIRNIIVPATGGAPAINLRADGEYSAWQLSIWTEGGYDWRYNDWLFTPHLSLKYSNLNVHALQEKGAGPLNLHVNYDDVEEFVLGGGLRAGYLVQLENNVTVHPHVYAQVFHDFINDGQQSTSNFVGGGSNFVTPGLTPDDTSFRLGAGVNFACLDNWMLSINYDYEFKDDYKAHGGFLKFRKEWA